jgi:hypothetical protein
MLYKRPLPSQEYLLECFDYSEGTGILLWKERPAHHFKSTHRFKTFMSQCAGKPAGHKARNGINILLDRKCCRAHRLIYKLKTGFDPPCLLDHENTDFYDNRWVNIRPASYAQNTWNRGKTALNKSGYKGVFPCGKGYRATIGKTYLGQFETAEAAYAAYCQAALERYGPFANFG